MPTKKELIANHERAEATVKLVREVWEHSYEQLKKHKGPDWATVENKARATLGEAMEAEFSAFRAAYL